MIEAILAQIYPLSSYHAIIAHGTFPKSPYLLKLIHQASSIICCDGAISNLLKHTIYPHYIIGDCDSLTKEVRQYFAEKIIEIPDQNTNDLTKAVHFTKHTLNAEHIIILGATGLREDHTIANIALLSEYTGIVKNIALISEYGIFTTHNKGKSTVATVPGQQISFFTLNPTTLITCAQLKWPLHNFSTHSWFQGSLNQAIGHSINVEVSDIVIIFRAFETKN